MTSFIAALQFLLLTPAFIRRPFSPDELGRSVAFYPLVGLLLGGILAAADALFGLLWPIPVRSALVLALWVIVTGGLHLDGFLDSCDGLLGGSTPERRLEIMRDERVGAFGVAGGVLLLLLMFSSLSTLAGDRWAALLLAPVLGRFGMSLAVVALPYARDSGLGRDIKDHARRSDLLVAALIALASAIAVALLLQSLAPVVVLLAAAAVYWLGTSFVLRRIPGMTGDTYGATNMLMEATTLLVFAAMLW
ncbi:MAG TPA: adenosylcobinamide-GDP ribazoletransferase [Anaerolineales bacterium]|nr:adenosylcobinamide-GDP ribazoletransferase [Anaerolineales bacterium]